MLIFRHANISVFSKSDSSQILRSLTTLISNTSTIYCIEIAYIFSKSLYRCFVPLLVNVVLSVWSGWCTRLIQGFILIRAEYPSTSYSSLLMLIAQICSRGYKLPREKASSQDAVGMCAVCVCVQRAIHRAGGLSFSFIGQRERDGLHDRWGSPGKRRCTYCSAGCGW